LLKTGMIITTYNVHLKAPFFPVVFVVKQRILCRTGPSLLSNQSFASHGPSLRTYKPIVDPKRGSTNDTVGAPSFASHEPATDIPS
jgi:hypothetical protein